MDLGLKGKVAVVTGGSAGIGLAAARIFLEEGAKVAICARGELVHTVAAELSALGEVYAEQVDMTVEQSVYDFAAHVYEKFGAIDCWVNNVGGPSNKKGDEYTVEEINFTHDVCFKSVVLGCQAAFRYMKKDCRGGSIVNVSSLAARCATAGTATLYGPLKAAVNGLTVTLAGEYCAYNVRVNGVMPGGTATELIKKNFTEDYLYKFAEATLLRRMADPSEIARPIVFMASDASSYMTATTIDVSAGRATTLNPSFSYDKLAAASK